MELNKLICCIEEAITSMYQNDFDLISRNNYEVSISCKLSQYLCFTFPDYQVDAEYDKHIDDDKRLNWVKRRPDIVIHKRWNDKDNLICIEIKKKTNTENRNNDYQKLTEFTNTDMEYWYKLWVFIDFGKDKKVNVVYFSEWSQMLKKEIDFNF